MILWWDLQDIKHLDSSNPAKDSEGLGPLIDQIHSEKGTWVLEFN